jgi:hypothetical protein
MPKTNGKGSSTAGDFLYVELSALGGVAEGKPFEAVSVGTFYDMHGRGFSLDSADLKAIVENTSAAIASSKTEGGEIVGLPIDKTNHDHIGGAGWIVGAELNADGKKILFTPKWTESGRELISTGERRFFSASINLDVPVIAGGTLCNWPASVDDKNRFVIRPLELASPMMTIEESLDAKSTRVRKEFMEEFGNSMSCPWVQEVYEAYLICSASDGLYKVAFTEDEKGDVEFVPVEQWTKVKINYVEAVMQGIKAALSSVFAGSKPEPTPKGETSMPKETVPPELAELASAAGDPAKLSELINRLADTKAAEMIEIAGRKAHVAEFAAAIVGGTKEKPAGLPFTVAEVVELMTPLDKTMQDKLEAMLTKIRDTGVVKFSETGHASTLEGMGTRELSAQNQAYLRQWLDADKKNTVEMWFGQPAIHEVLGDAKDYNLTAFKPEGKE